MKQPPIDQAYIKGMLADIERTITRINADRENAAKILRDGLKRYEADGESDSEDVLLRTILTALRELEGS